MPEDRSTTKAEGEQGRPDAPTRLSMYRAALRIRMVEQEIVDRYSEQEMRCPTHICIGQEGAPAGVSAHLKTEDAVFSAHRSHGHYLAKNADLKSMLAELYGRETGCARGKGGSQHLVDLEAGFMGSAPILASTISVGVGYAWAAKRRGQDRIVVIYFGDGATEEGAFHEAANFAGVNKLPVLFVCENNLYSVHSKLEIRQPEGRKVHQLADAHGALGLFGDGNDIDEVWRLAKSAVSHIRAGNGPVILELMTYRWKEHCGPNEDLMLNYRSQEEFDAWVERDPVATYRARLLDEGVLSKEAYDSYQSEISREIEAAFDFAIASPFPSTDELFDFVYPAEGQAQ
jgi:TPP-dependent pyruvate/acetoin dehydrogenase alpha subunit